MRITSLYGPVENVFLKIWSLREDLEEVSNGLIALGKPDWEFFNEIRKRFV